MTAPDTGGPAFPLPTTQIFDGSGNVTGQEWGMPGMTLLDWFAGQALAGLCADPNVLPAPDQAPKWLYRLAAGMIAEKRRVEAGEP